MTWDEMEPNVIPMTPAEVCRRMAEEHGQDAAREAMARADGYFQAGMLETGVVFAQAAEMLERRLGQPTRQ